MSENVLPVSSSKSFIGRRSPLCKVVSHFIFKSLTHFEFIVFGGMEWESILASLIYMQLSNFPNTTSQSHVYSCLLCHRLIGCMCVGLFLGLCSVQLSHMSVFLDSVLIDCRFLGTCPFLVTC